MCMFHKTVDYRKVSKYHKSDMFESIVQIYQFDHEGSEMNYFKSSYLIRIKVHS